jgi:transposase-like protein
LEVVLGEGAKKLTPAVLSELKKSWTKEFNEWNTRDLSKVRFTYLFVDGIYQEIRGDNPKICVLVLMGVDTHGRKHLISIEDGVRESTQSWREVLLGAKARGLKAPKLATGDGALGFWAALEEVFPSTTHQRSTRPSIPAPSSVSPRTARSCSPSTTSRPSTGCTSAPPTPLSPRSRRCVTAPSE